MVIKAIRPDGVKCSMLLRFVSLFENGDCLQWHLIGNNIKINGMPGKKLVRDFSFDKATITRRKLDGTIENLTRKVVP